MDLYAVSQFGGRYENLAQISFVESQRGEYRHTNTELIKSMTKSVDMLRVFGQLIRIFNSMYVPLRMRKSTLLYHRLNVTELVELHIEPVSLKLYHKEWLKGKLDPFESLKILEVFQCSQCFFYSSSRIDLSKCFPKLERLIGQFGLHFENGEDATPNLDPLRMVESIIFVLHPNTNLIELSRNLIVPFLQRSNAMLRTMVAANMHTTLERLQCIGVADIHLFPLGPILSMFTNLKHISIRLFSIGGEYNGVIAALRLMTQLESLHVHGENSLASMGREARFLIRLSGEELIRNLKIFRIWKYFGDSNTQRLLRNALPSTCEFIVD